MNEWFDPTVKSFKQLSRHIKKMCKDHQVILFVDEVDKTSNNIIFLNFLSMLREKYLQNQKGKDETFQSVVLVGVYDIKNIKVKMVNQGVHTLKESEGIYNSPWNIAVDLDVDMSLHVDEIVSMLSEYENDYCTGMNISLISQKIYEYTSGYPFLVSRICQIIDKKLNRNWSEQGVDEAVKLILIENNTLFDDFSKNMENYPELYQFIYEILVIGERRSYQIVTPLIKLGVTFGFFKNENGNVIISNRMFELFFTNYFIAKDESNYSSKRIVKVLPSDIIKNDRFHMSLCLEKFAMHYQEIFSAKDIMFLEKHGRLLFLTYLKPLINEKGFYYIESSFTDLRRMDIVVDYGNEQFVIELKLWYGEVEHQKAYEQLVGYLEHKNMKKGYLLTFDFRKDRNKEYKAEWVSWNGKEIFDVVC